jgi:pSer/pThr/pTyr-binding forkhead associated (FHA) protein
MSNQSRNLFREACGSTGPFWLAIQRPDEAEPAYQTFALPYAVLGRDPRADLVLDDPAVSPRHVYIQMIAGRLWCVDLGSGTGTQWLDSSGEIGWLDRGRAIQIGPFYIWRIDPGPDLPPLEARFSPLAANSPAAESLPAVSLEFVNQALQIPYAMSRVLTLAGQAADCKIRLVSSTVGRYHAGLLRTRHGLWAVDLIGGGAISVADTAVPWARLDDGDHIKVGKFVMRVRFQPAAANPGKTTVLAQTDTHVPLNVEPAPDPKTANLPVSRPSQPLALPGSQGGRDPEVSALPVSRVLENKELVQVVLLPLANQFAQMQQQMFDQFQQALVSVVEMFSGLQKEQFALIRQELDQIHELTTEMHTLQIELARQRVPVDAPAPSGPNGALHATETAPRSLPPIPEPVATQQEVLAGAGDGNVPDPVPAPAPIEPPAPSDSNASPAETPANTETTSHPVHNDRDIHGWLEHRLAAIQEERQSRWRKVLNFILGKKGEPPP